MMEALRFGPALIGRPERPDGRQAQRGAGASVAPKRRWGAVRWSLPEGYSWWSLLGLLLLVTAGLKADPRVALRIGSLGLMQSPAVWLVLVWVEVALGCWVLSGLYPAFTVRLLLACFTALALAALGLALSGFGSCGCLGVVAVPPWVMSCFDAAVALLLLVGRGKVARGPTVRSHGHRALAAAVAALVLGGLLTAKVARSWPVALGSDRPGQPVVLEPRSWSGRMFPLGPHLEWDGEPPDLTRGRWIVVLHRRGCLRCQDLLTRLASDGASPFGSLRLALIELPTDEQGAARGELEPPRRPPSMAVGRLRGDRDWFATTPILIELEDGIVRGLPSLPEGPG